MKKLVLFIIVGVLVLSGLGAVAVNNDTTYSVMKIVKNSVAVSQPVIRDAGEYVTVNLEEAESSLQDPGNPVLPVVTQVFTLPFGSKIKSVDVSFSNTKKLVLPKEIIPAPELLPVKVNLQLSKELVKNEKVYAETDLYPSSSFRYTVGSGISDTEHVVYVAVQCYFIRYSPVQNMIYYSESADIRVVYEEPLNPIEFPDEYDLVVIAPEEYTAKLQPLISHKNSLGVNTTFKATEDIYTEYSGVDKPEKIKYFIKDALETLGVDYVLLVGSIDKLPIRATWFYMGHHGEYWNTTVLCDLYYSDIYDEYGDFCSWDSDGDGKFGEIYRNCPGVNDTVDLYPDVNVGRLACTSAAEVATVVDKIIHYENNTYGKSWYNNIILAGGDTFPNWNGYEGEEKNILTEAIMSDFVPTRLWTSTGTFGPLRLNRAVNKGAGFIDYSGHGFEIGIGTHPPNDAKWISYYTPYLTGVLNGYKLPIIYFDACLTAKLDFNSSDLANYPSYNPVYKTLSVPKALSSFDLPSSNVYLPCFAWSWVKKGNGGAIATIGATRTAYGGLDYGTGYLSLRFFEAYSTSDTVSEMLTKAQIDYISHIWWKDYFTVEEFILLGDPSLKLGGYDVNPVPVVDPVVGESGLHVVDLETVQNHYGNNQLLSQNLLGQTNLVKTANK